MSPGDPRGAAISPFLNAVAEFLIDFSTALKQDSVYGASHPIARHHRERLYAKLLATFRLQPRIDLNFAGETILCQDHFLDRRNPIYRQLAKSVSGLGIAGVTFAQGVLPQELAGFLAKDRFEVESDLQKLAALFPERGGRYRAFHKSISDWLCGTAGRSKTFRINVQAGHRRIGAKLLEAFQAGQREPGRGKSEPRQLGRGQLDRIFQALGRQGRGDRADWDVHGREHDAQLKTKD